MTDEPTTIYFIRHGNIYNPEQIYYGRLPGFPLSKEGEKQSLRVAEYLKGTNIHAIYSSPLLRGKQTAQIVLSALDLGLQLNISELLNDSFTPYDGCPLQDVISRNWDIYKDIKDPSYEQPKEILQRTKDLFNRIRRKYHNKNTLVIGHGDPIAFYILWALNEPITTEPTKQLEILGFPESYPATASLSIFKFLTRSVDEIPQFEYVKPY